MLPRVRTGGERGEQLGGLKPGVGATRHGYSLHMYNFNFKRISHGQTLWSADIATDMPSCPAYVCVPKADVSCVFGVKVLQFAVINRGRDSMLQTPMFLHWFLVRRRPPRGYGRSQRISFFETMPSRPSLQTGLNICLPSPSVCSTN